MIFDPKQLTTRENYQLLTGSVVPRPIAWVGTLGPGGGRNLAPFSFFGAVSAAPLLLMVSVGKRRGARKDTANNLLSRRQCVVHVPDASLASAMVASSAEVGPEVDEFELAGLTAVGADIVDAPRLVDAAVAFECRLLQHLELGDGPNDVFFLEAVRAHVADRLLGADGLPDAAKWLAVGRLGKNEYCTTASLMVMDRPGETR